MLGLAASRRTAAFASSRLEAVPRERGFASFKRAAGMRGGERKAELRARCNLVERIPGREERGSCARGSSARCPRLWGGSPLCDASRAGRRVYREHSEGWR